MAIMTVAPAKPPPAAAGVKASLRIIQRTAGISEMCEPMTSSDNTQYRQAMKGTSLPATWPTRETPPMMTVPASSSNPRAVTQTGMPNVPARLALMALACTMAPVPMHAIMQKMQKSVPIQVQRLPRPFLMKYMAPPTQLPAGVFSRNCTESMTSANFVTMPTMAVTHIQNRAPGPPTEMAVATPTMLPVPMVPASAVIRAFQGEISPSAD